MPANEFSEFLGAVSHIGALGRTGALDALTERAERPRESVEADRRALRGGAVSRLFVIEADYALHMARAERAWVLAAIEQIRDGRLTWPGQPRER